MAEKMKTTEQKLICTPGILSNVSLIAGLADTLQVILYFTFTL
jgi:hypothetical protein